MLLADIHCHLLPTLDDGPSGDEEALAMCRLAVEDGVRLAAAVAHQNECWPDVTPERIQQATGRLSRMLRDAGIPLTVLPGAEVTVYPEIEQSWLGGKLLSLAGRGEYLLVEMPHNLFFDLSGTVRRLMAAGVRPVLAHAEREPMLLYEPGVVERLVDAGCLVQVNASSLAAPTSARDTRALKRWLERGLVHVLGSDAHGAEACGLGMSAAYHRIASWVGTTSADRICNINATAMLHGLPLRIPRPNRGRPRWMHTLWRPLRGGLVRNTSRASISGENGSKGSAGIATR